MYAYRSINSARYLTVLLLEKLLVKFFAHAVQSLAFEVIS